MDDERSRPDSEGRSEALDSGLIVPAMPGCSLGSADLPPVSAIEIPGYTILRRLGAGGMGVVYEAEQESPRRRVAIKIAGGQGCGSRVRVLRHEAQVLAHIDHPGIAAIYEAGETQDSRQFLAMELARGPSLSSYLESKPAADGQQVHDRLLLFLQICDAIDFAHQRGVIHRDLTPANILVLDDRERDAGSSPHAAPRIKILDFGLARFIDADIAGLTVETESGLIQGTLPYMSPEQTRGTPDAIDRRTDVYALGVILYEMLCGALPYELADRPILDAVRVVCEQTPRRPSSCCRLVRGDVETIILKAIDKEPECRYQSVSSLAGDVRRLLADQPILARPTSAGYQIRKLIRRHKLPFVFAAALFAVVVTFGVTMSLLFAGQRQVSARAELEARKAEQVASFLEDMLSAAAPEREGQAATVRQVLDRAAGEIDTRLAEQPGVRASVQTVIGKTYRSLGEYEAARRHLETALTEHRNLHAGDHPETAETLDQLGSLHFENGDYARSESYFRQAIDMYRHLHGDERLDVATSLANLSIVLGYLGRREEAKQLSYEALVIRRRLLGDDHPDLAHSFTNLAGEHLEDGEFAQAEALARKVLEINRRTFGDRHPAVANALNNLAVILGREGRYIEALPLYDECLAISRELQGIRHPMYAHYLGNLAQAIELEGDWRRADSLYNEVLRIQLETEGEEHTHTGFSHRNLGRIRLVAGDYAAAERHFTQAENLLVANLGAGHAAVAGVRYQRAELEWRRGNLGEAERRYADVIACQRATLGADHPELAETLLGLSCLLLDTGRAAAAEPLLRECLRIRERRLPAGHWQTDLAECALGACLMALDRSDGADLLLTHGSVERLCESRVAPGERRAALLRLARAYEAAGDPGQAGSIRARIDATCDGSFERDHLPGHGDTTLDHELVEVNPGR